MDVQAEVLQGSILGPFFKKIQINDLLYNQVSNPKLFADNTHHYFLQSATDPNVTANQINNDLHNISTQAYQWKTNINPDTSKQGQEVLFSRKVKVTAHP